MDAIKKTVDALILSGAIELTGFDEKTKQPLYKFNEKIQQIMPELYKEHLNEVNRDIMFLWETGFLSIDFLSDDPLVTLTEKAYVDEYIEKISLEHQAALEEIKRLLTK